MAVLEFAEVASDLVVLVRQTGELDQERVQLMVTLAMDAVRQEIDPVPVAARGIVLGVAVRGYVNITGAESQTVGPFAQTFSKPGVYLTAREQADLRRLAHVRGAFTITPGPRR